MLKSQSIFKKMLLMMICNSSCDIGEQTLYASKIFFLWKLWFFIKRKKKLLRSLETYCTILILDEANDLRSRSSLLFKKCLDCYKKNQWFHQSIQIAHNHFNLIEKKDLFKAQAENGSFDFDLFTVLIEAVLLLFS